MSPCLAELRTLCIDSSPVPISNYPSIRSSPSLPSICLLLFFAFSSHFSGLGVRPRGSKTMREYALPVCALRNPTEPNCNPQNFVYCRPKYDVFADFHICFFLNTFSSKIWCHIPFRVFRVLALCEKQSCTKHYVNVYSKKRFRTILVRSLSFKCLALSDLPATRHHHSFVSAVLMSFLLYFFEVIHRFSLHFYSCLSDFLLSSLSASPFPAHFFVQKSVYSRVLPPSFRLQLLIRLLTFFTFGPAIFCGRGKLCFEFCGLPLIDPPLCLLNFARPFQPLSSLFTFELFWMTILNITGWQWQISNATLWLSAGLLGVNRQRQAIDR